MRSKENEEVQDQTLSQPLHPHYPHLGQFTHLEFFEILLIR